MAPTEVMNPKFGGTFGATRHATSAEGSPSREMDAFHTKDSPDVYRSGLCNEGS